ncbi:hypothetical protein DFJ74DRAFT_344789 [Hyaloraphidium curvatum]|nr:hypothetical protein DFJ74DRAFT_344789 [Hyaloraphidium curvatum]
MGHLAPVNRSDNSPPPPTTRPVLLSLSSIALWGPAHYATLRTARRAEARTRARRTSHWTPRLARINCSAGHRGPDARDVPQRGEVLYQALWRAGGRLDRRLGTFLTFPHSSLHHCSGFRGRGTRVRQCIIRWNCRRRGRTPSAGEPFGGGNRGTSTVRSPSRPPTPTPAVRGAAACRAAVAVSMARPGTAAAGPSVPASVPRPAPRARIVAPAPSSRTGRRASSLPLRWQASRRASRAFRSLHIGRRGRSREPLHLPRGVRRAR